MRRRQGIIGAAVAVAASLIVGTSAGAMKLTDRGTVPCHDGPSSALTIQVDPTRRYQQMDGFGASITDSSAQVLYRLSSQNRTAAMTDLFSPAKGDGLSFLRQPMGASDFVQGPHYTYDDLPA